MSGPTVRRWLAPMQVCAIGVGLAATLLVLARIGYWRMFSVFAFHDDEGCVLITIREFMAGHALYDDVFSMYGPLPVLLRSVLFAASGQPVGHDVGRLFSLTTWLASATLGGAVAWRLTGSAIAGWAGMLFVFHGLAMCVFEPGHPQELCALLLVLAVLLATFVGRRRGRRTVPVVAGIGIVAGCLAMSKINVFVFLMLALGAAALAVTARTRLVSVLLLLYAAALLAVPTVLMRQRFDVPGFESYALHVTLALIPTLLLGFGRRWEPLLGVRHYMWFTIGLLGSVAAIAGMVLQRGTTVGGLLDGILLIPLRAGAHFISVAPFFDGRWPITVSFCVGALVWLALERRGWAARNLPTLCSVALRIVFGAYVLDWERPDLAVPYVRLFAFGVPAAVLVLLPRTVVKRATGDTFGRLVLAFLAVTDSLWAFPVAGSQQAFSTFLTALLMVIVVADGCRDGAAFCRRWAWWPTWTARWPVQTVVAALLLSILRLETDASRAQYERLVPLALPGAEAIHVTPDLALYYRHVSEALRALPDTFFTFPGMFSFYFWTEREPPTALNLTNWMYILDDRQQERVVAQLATHPQLRVLVSPRLIGFWMRGFPVAPTPLVRYLNTDFAPESQFDGVAIWARHGAPSEPRADLPAHG